MGNGGNLGAVYAGRFVAGLGVGQTVVVAPVYLAEIVSPFIALSTFTIRVLTTDQGTCLHSWYLYLHLHWLRLSR